MAASKSKRQQAPRVSVAAVTKLVRLLKDNPHMQSIQVGDMVLTAKPASQIPKNIEVAPQAQPKLDINLSRAQELGPAELYHNKKEEWMNRFSASPSSIKGS